MKNLLLRGYDLIMTRLNCCGVGVGCGCAIIIIAPLGGLIGTGTWLILT